MKKFRVADDSEFITDATNIYDIIERNAPEGRIYETIIGEQISQDKTVSQISAGYTTYFKTEHGLKTYSAFHFTVEKRETK